VEYKSGQTRNLAPHFSFNIDFSSETDFKLRFGVVVFVWH